MKNLTFLIVFLLFQSSCFYQANMTDKSLVVDAPARTASENTFSSVTNENLKPYTENIENAYPGISIDQQFPLIANHDFQETDLKEKIYFVNADDFQITVKNLAPKIISKNGKAVFKYKTIYPSDYHSNLVGVSQLLGRNSKEIYVVTNGPGAVCCTNYWIADVSKGKPRNIFRSEDFGGFRDAMEVFDADGDGVYELVQFDAAFRYFMDDCGSCSPEPRAVFKYNKRTRTYLPAKGIQQDFVEESLAKTGKWLEETFNKLKKENDVGLELDFKRSSLAYIVDLFYLGETRKAWKTFDRYFDGWFEKEKIRAEIKHRLKQSKFYQTLKNSAD